MSLYLRVTTLAGVETLVVSSNWALKPNAAGKLPAATGLEIGGTAEVLTATNIVYVTDFRSQAEGIDGYKAKQYIVA